MSQRESVCAEQAEILYKQLADKLFRGIFEPLSAYTRRALDCIPPEVRPAVISLSFELRETLLRHGGSDPSVALLALLHETTLEADAWHRRFLAPLADEGSVSDTEVT